MSMTPVSRLLRERDAIELLRRIYERDAEEVLLDSDMFAHWVDWKIADFIRKHGTFEDLARIWSEVDLDAASEYDASIEKMNTQSPRFRSGGQ